jgi:hypothetical protein
MAITLLNVANSQDTAITRLNVANSRYISVTSGRCHLKITIFVLKDWRMLLKGSYRQISDHDSNVNTNIS